MSKLKIKRSDDRFDVDCVYDESIGFYVLNIKVVNQTLINILNVDVEPSTFGRSSRSSYDKIFRHFKLYVNSCAYPLNNKLTTLNISSIDNHIEILITTLSGEVLFKCDIEHIKEEGNVEGSKVVAGLNGADELMDDVMKRIDGLESRIKELSNWIKTLEKSIQRVDMKGTGIARL